MPILPPAPILDPMIDAANVNAIDYSADFKILFGWFDAHTKLYNKGKTKNNLVRYTPGTIKSAHQGQLDGTLTKKAYADDTSKGLKIEEFNMKLNNNQYMDFHNAYSVFPIKIKKKKTKPVTLQIT